jgi:hypothetical protein
MDFPPFEEVPNHKELSATERAALMMQLGILIQEIGNSYELGLDIQVAIARHLFPDDNYKTAKKKLDDMLADIDDLGQMVFDKDPKTQNWRLAIAWEKDQ